MELDIPHVMRWFFLYFTTLGSFLPNHVSTKSLPLYSYDNSMLVLLHPFDPKLLKPFDALAEYSRVSVYEMLRYLDQKRLSGNPLYNNSACVVDVTSIVYGIIRSDKEAVKCRHVCFLLFILPKGWMLQARLFLVSLVVVSTGWEAWNCVEISQILATVYPSMFKESIALHM